MSRKIEDGLTNGQRWLQRHPEAQVRINENARKARAEDPERFREYSRKNYRKHAEDRRRAKREYDRATNAARAGTEDGREFWRMKAERRRARKAKVECTLTMNGWLAILGEHGHRCAYCGSAGPLEQDHVVPLSRGGGHTAENVVPACKPCNASKGAK